MATRRRLDFKTCLYLMSKRFRSHSRVHNNVLCFAIVTSRSWMGLWRHCWRRQWLGRVHCTDWEWDLCLECPLRFTSSYFLNYFIFHVIKGIKNGCPCIVEIRGTHGCALAWSLHSPAARAGSPTKAQPCVPLISTMHRQPFLDPLINQPARNLHIGSKCHHEMYG